MMLRAFPRAAAALALLCSAWMGACTGRDDGRTTGITTIGNTVAGVVVDDKGTLVANAEVRLLPAAYDPANDPAETGYKTARTDSTGHFRFKELDAGDYNLEATREGFAAYLPGLKLGADHPEDTGSVVKLDRPGAITVVFGRLKVEYGGRFYMPGTTRNRRIDTSDVRLGSLTLPYVGAGRYASLRYQAPEDSIGGEVLAPRNLDVTQDDTVIVLAEPGWALIRKVTLNTSGSGANVPGDVADFPVLVRLNPSNFDFAKARKDGGDIRFARPDGSRLAYETARWEPDAGTAEFWVKLDTAHGATRAQCFYLMAGNADSADSQDSKAVFSAADLEGAWHFDSGSLPNSPLPDAAGGDPAMNRGAELVEGLSGKAMRFRGTAWVDMPAKTFGSISRKIALSFWQKSGDTVQAQPGDVLGATDPGGSVVLRMHNPFGDSLVSWQAGALGTQPLDKLEKKPDAEATNRTRWNFWTLTKDADKGEMKIYLNGKVWASATGKTASIGKVQSFALSFSGTDAYALDEFRLHKTASSDDWIKLSYETQRTGGTAVSVGK